MSDADVKMPEPVAHVHTNGDFCGVRQIVSEVWPVDLVTADQLRAAVLAERERCAKVCEEGASHGRHQMRTDPINTAFWNGYAAGADQCATDILESDHAD